MPMRAAAPRAACKKAVMNTYKNMVIRPTSLADATAYRALRLEALRLHPTAFASDYVTDVNKPVEFWQQRLQLHEGKDMLLVAESQDALVGMCGIRRAEGVKYQHNATIWGVYVRAEWRGKGVAEALLKGCMAWAKDHAITIVKLGVSTNNPSAIKFYLKCGFSIYGVEPLALRVDGADLNEFLMARNL